MHASAKSSASTTTSSTSGGTLLGAALSLGISGSNRLATSGVHYLGDALGVETRDKNASDVVGMVHTEVTKPETQAAIRDAANIVATAVEAARPGIDRMVDQVEQVTLDMGKRAIVVGQNLVSEIPVVGPILEFPIMISNIVRAGQKVVESGAQLTTIGADTLLVLRERIQAERAKLTPDAIADEKNKIVSRVNARIDTAKTLTQPTPAP